ncbi:MFS transporter [Mucilaginibacter yixingensis]|nr:MFS transporter [Mucilaginibacter yixingensis]
MTERTGLTDNGHKYRWKICVLLFFATSINYLDRQVLGILAPELTRMFKWSEADYGIIISAFKWAYAIGLLCAGAILDKIGTKKGFTIFISIWSVVSMLHAAARSLMGFIVARFALGIGEAGNFPACIKTVAGWFPVKERAFATGLFNSGSNIGAIIAPLLIPWLFIKWGWQWAFLVTGLLGLIWLAFWLAVYRKPDEHPGLHPDERSYILADRPTATQEKVPFRLLLKDRRVWIICLCRFLTDPVWWFFLYWLPKFLSARFHIELLDVAAPIIAIYVISDLGSIAGGWYSSWQIKHGHSVDSARKRTILICGLMALPVTFAAVTNHLWVAVGFISLATAAHQAWAANIYTIVSDIFPQNKVGTLTGLAGTFGAVGGALGALIVGIILQVSHSYIPIFISFSSMYLVAWFLLRVFVKIET